MSDSLDPDQARRFVGLYIGPNCLQRLSADDKSLLAGNVLRISDCAGLYFLYLKLDKFSCDSVSSKFSLSCMC